MARRRHIVVVPGDGIGPEVIHEGVRALKLLDKKVRLDLQFTFKDWSADKWIRDGVGLEPGALDDLRANCDAIYFGALGDPRIPDMAHGRDILLGLRFGLDLYVNWRPIRLLHERLGVLKNKTKQDVDFVVFRENTEDSYVSIGGNFKPNMADEVAIDESIHTRKGVERIIRFAFEYARTSGRRKVTLGDKSNAIRFGGGLWQRVSALVAKEYPDIQHEHLFVDVMAMEFVQHPERFDVVVTSNLFGDILTDLGAGIAGGLGIASSANIHPGRIGLFEPVHGSAPDIAGKQRANPLAAYLSAAMMLSFLDAPQAALMLQEAVERCIDESVGTPDIGGSASTSEVGDWICRYLS